jgi:hypothetical protein
MNLPAGAYVSMRNAAKFLDIGGKDPGENARLFLIRHGVPLYRLGRQRRVLRTSLEALMTRQRKQPRSA